MINIKKISFEYEGKSIFRELSLQIREGDFLAIIGHNGSGKTTLIKHLNALLLPNKGDVLIDNLNTKSNDWEIKNKVGIVFQNPDDQLINSIVEEDIAFGLENLGLSSVEIQAKVAYMLKKLGITQLAKENINNLSFGQKQLIALAGVLVMEPKYIVFDEPTTMLDPKNKTNILKIIKQLNKEGKTIIMVTNNMDDIKEHVNEVIVLKKGRILFHGAKKKLSIDILRKADLYG